MQSRLKVYIALVAAIAAYLLVRCGFALPEEAWLPLAALAVVAAVFETLPMELPNGTRFTLGSAVYFVAYLGYGSAVAMWVVTIAVTAYAIIMKEEYYRAVFNAGNYIISLTVAGTVFQLSGGSVGADQWSSPLPLLLFILTEFFVNTGLLSIVFWQVSGEPVHRVWLTLGLDAYLGHFAVMTLGLLAATMLNQGLVPVLALFLVLFLLQRLFASYFNLIGASRKREQILTTILDSTDNGILLVGADGDILHSNHRATEFLGLKADDLLGENFSALPLPDPGDGRQQEVFVRRPIERTLRVNRIPVRTTTMDASDTSAVISLTDITVEREAATKLKEYEASIRTLVAAVDARDEYTHGHSERVSEYSVQLGHRLDLSHREIDDLRHGGLLHDIGKIGIDDRILRKAGALTPEERALMMEHPAKGAAILAQAGAFQSILPIVLYHHEWHGGGGYPTGRKGSQIPLVARITSVADAFDAMTSHRHYRKGMPIEEALKRLVEGKGTQFDPELVDLFVSGIEDGHIPILQHPDDLPAPEHIDEEATGRILPVHRQELQVIYRIALETRLFLDLKRLLPRVLEILSETLGHEQYYLVFAEPDSKAAEVVAELGGEGPSRVSEGDIADWVIRTGQPVLFSRKQKDLGHLRPRSDAAGSALGVALEVGGRVVGCLCCESTDVDRYNQDSLYLMKAVAGQIASAVQIARYHERVRESAMRDGLTGIFNHTFFYEEGEKELTEARSKGTRLSLAVLDVNGLKEVNDRHGHLAGDYLLRHYASLLRERARPEDKLARVGGDEFMMILPDLSLDEARRHIGDMVAAIQPKIEWNGVEIRLAGLAWGVASYPKNGGRLMELIDAADRAMYDQKRSKKRVLHLTVADQ